jgi:hypothetical protein
MATYSTVCVEFTFFLFKGSTRRETRGLGKMAIFELWFQSDHDDWPQQCTLYCKCTLYSIIFCEFFSRNLTTVLVMIEEPLLYLQPCCLEIVPSVCRAKARTRDILGGRRDTNLLTTTFASVSFSCSSA